MTEQVIAEVRRLREARLALDKTPLRIRTRKPEVKITKTKERPS